MSPGTWPAQPCPAAPTDDVPSRRNASAALGNIAYGHASYQRAMGAVGAVEALVNLCSVGIRQGVGQAHVPLAVALEGITDDTVGVDADVVENVTAALASLAGGCEDNAVKIGMCGGIAALMALLSIHVAEYNEVSAGALLGGMTWAYMEARVKGGATVVVEFLMVRDYYQRCDNNEAHLVLLLD